MRLGDSSNVFRLPDVSLSKRWGQHQLSKVRTPRNVDESKESAAEFDLQMLTISWPRPISCVRSGRK